MSAIADRQAAVNTLYATLFPAPVPVAPASACNGPAPLSLTDAEVLSRAQRARNGAKVTALVNGDIADCASHSEADARLIGYLSFYTTDPDQLDRLYRSTRLYRAKWERADYRAATIALGLQRDEHWTPREASAPDSATASGQISGGPLGVAPDEVAGADYHATDSGNAELFASRNSDRLRFNHRLGAWLVWDTHRWRPDTTGAVRQLAKEVARERLRAAAELDDKDERKRAVAWALASESRQRLDALLSLAEAEPPLADAGDDWDADPWLLGVANGVLDLRTGALRPGRQADRITHASPVTYDHTAPAPRWERFLVEVFQGDVALIDWLWRFVGYTITGDTREQVLAIAHGGGSNGKSTFLRALAYALGSYAYNLPFSALEQNARSGVPNDLAALVGRRFVTASETNEGTRLNEGRLKALTGGDPITARLLFHEHFTFLPVAKFWLATNHKPRVADDSYGFWRRVRLIPFLASFKGRAVDQRLDDTLRAEAAGILAWAVRGCLAWQERGLSDTPAAVASATDDYRTESDPLGDFLADHCVIEEAATVAAAELYRAYKGWAEEQGLRERETLSSTLFGRRVSEHFPKAKRKAGWTYRGIRLRTPLDPPGDAFEAVSDPYVHPLPEPQNAPRATGAGLAEPNPAPDFPSRSAVNQHFDADPLENLPYLAADSSHVGRYGENPANPAPGTKPGTEPPDVDELAALFDDEKGGAAASLATCPGCLRAFDGASGELYCFDCAGGGS